MLLDSGSVQMLNEKSRQNFKKRRLFSIGTLKIPFYFIVVLSITTLHGIQYLIKKPVDQVSLLQVSELNFDDSNVMVASQALTIHKDKLSILKPLEETGYLGDE